MNHLKSYKTCKKFNVEQDRTELVLPFNQTLKRYIKKSDFWGFKPACGLRSLYRNENLWHVGEANIYIFMKESSLETGLDQLEY